MRSDSIVLHSRRSRVRLAYQFDNLTNRPHMRTQSRLHRRGNPQGLVNPSEVVVHVEQGEHRDVVLDLLREGVGQAGKAPHVHSHVEVLSLNVAGRNVSLIGGADNLDALGALTLRRAVALLCLRIIAVHLHKLRVVDVRTRVTC
jgi:hypothetical protein